jgi:hypothetical protein
VKGLRQETTALKEVVADQALEIRLWGVVLKA